MNPKNRQRLVIYKLNKCFLIHWKTKKFYPNKGYKGTQIKNKRCTLSWLASSKLISPQFEKYNLKTAFFYFNSRAAWNQVTGKSQQSQPSIQSIRIERKSLKNKTYKSLDSETTEVIGRASPVFLFWVTLRLGFEGSQADWSKENYSGEVVKRTSLLYEPNAHSFINVSSTVILNLIRMEKRDVIEV